MMWPQDCCQGRIDGQRVTANFAKEREEGIHRIRFKFPGVVLKVNPKPQTVSYSISGLGASGYL